MSFRNVGWHRTPKHAAPEPLPSSGVPRPVRLSLIALFWALLAASAVAIGLGRWVRKEFGVVSLEQALMNLQGAGQEGAGGSDLVTNAVVQSVIVPLSIVGLLALLTFVLSRLRGAAPSPRFTRVTIAAACVTAIGAPLLGFSTLNSSLQLGEHIALNRSSTDIADFYAKPVVVNEGTAEKPNLILIYLESIENTFGNDELFELDMLQDLVAATPGWDAVESLAEYAGGGWTMSGIVSTQCGVPLRPSSAETVDQSISQDEAEKNALNVVEGRSSYLSGADCLGDVLSRNGYKNVFMGGALATFAGKDTFLQSHGYGKVLDLAYWESVGETEVSTPWGLSDRRLFDNAKIEAMELRESGEPFNLTLLTLDTHEPLRRFDYCEASTDVGMTSVTRCSMGIVADFVDFLTENGFLEDTTVVIMGDHLKLVAESKAYFEELSATPDRTIFNRIWTPSGEQVKFHDITQLDMYPTILEAMGFDLLDGVAGLGVSAYYEGTPPSSLRALPKDDQRVAVRSRSRDFYDQLWNVHQQSDSK